MYTCTRNTGEGIIITLKVIIYCLVSELWHTFSHDRALIEVGTGSLVVLQYLLLLVVSPLLLHLLPCLMVTLIRLHV